MKKQSQFYSLLNSLHKLSTYQYAKFIKTIINGKEFKRLIKDDKIKVIFINKQIFTSSCEDIYFYKDEIGNFYYFKYFMITFNYELSDEKLNLKLMNINIINNAVYNFIQLLICKQKLFLNSNLIKDLFLVDRVCLVNEYQIHHNKYFDKTLISRIIKKNFRLGDDIYNLSFLIPKRSYYHSIFIYKIINDKSYLNDNEITKELYSKYAISLNRREVCYIRNKYFIPKVTNRKEVLFYKEYESRFSEVKVLNKINLQKVSCNKSGVYELLSYNLQQYPYSTSNTIYIGSSINIKKRLNTYLNFNFHNVLFNKYFETERIIYFRYIKNEYQKVLEKNFLDSFDQMFGSLPLLNIQKIK